MGLFGWKKKNETDLAAAMAEAAGLNDELIAVITAAVCAYEAEQYVKSLHIRKLNRAAGVRPVWSATGTNEAIDVRRL
jgi:hypothetical protein